MNANEARKLSAQNQNEFLNKQFIRCQKKIKNEIDNAINAGKFSFKSNVNIEKQTIKRITAWLEANGFKVFFNPFDLIFGKYLMTVSWGEDDDKHERTE